MERSKFRAVLSQLKVGVSAILIASIAFAGNFDNLGFNGNTISSRNANGNIVLDPNGTGGVLFTDQIATTIPYFDANKKLVSSTTTPTELDYLHSGGLPRSKFATGTANHVLINDGSGNFSSESNLAISRGGTGAGTKAAGFDALSPMSASGDVIYGGTSGTGTRLAKGSDGQVLKLASGVPTWATDSTGGSTATYRSVTTTDSPTTSDEILDLSGASFTITLPTAVGNAGKQFTLTHLGTNFSQVYTIAVTGGTQTIGGIASGSYKLTTNGESLTIYSDGANYKIKTHSTSTAWASYTPTFNLTNTGTPQGKWRRVGDSMEVEVYVICTGTPGAVATALFTIPSGPTMDTGKVTAGGFKPAGTGFFYKSSTDTRYTAIGAVPASTTEMRAMYNGSPNAIGSSTNTPVAWAVNDTYELTFKVPITDWQP